MGKTNEFLQKQAAMRQRCLDIGMDAGFQKCWDLVQLCLNDPAVMGKDTLGKARLDKLFTALHAYERGLGNAWLDELDSDVMQQRLDDRLKQIHGKDFVPFPERYPYVVQADYSRGKRKWRQEVSG